MKQKYKDLEIPTGLTSRDKSIKGRKNGYWGNDSAYFCLKEQSDGVDRHEGLLFLMLLDNYSKRNNDVSFHDLVTADRGWHQYWQPYINAKECRNIVEYFRSALKRGCVYMLEKEMKVKPYAWGDWVKTPYTLVITKHPYTEEKLFMKALCDGGIRGLNGSEKNFFFKMMKFMENSKGIWH